MLNAESGEPKPWTEDVDNGISDYRTIEYPTENTVTIDHDEDRGREKRRSGAVRLAALAYLPVRLIEEANPDGGWYLGLAPDCAGPHLPGA